MAECVNPQCKLHFNEVATSICPYCQTDLASHPSTKQVPKVENEFNVRSLNFIYAALQITACGLVLFSISKNAYALLFFLPLIFFPIIITCALSYKFKSTSSQLTLLLSQILFSAWVTYVYLDAFHWHPDAQSPIALAFIGPYSLPIMGAFWSVAFVIRNPKNA